MFKIAVLWAIITGVLKLSGVLAWPWLAVLGPLGAVMLFVLVVTMVAIVAAVKIADK